MTRYAPLWQQAGNYTASLDRQGFRATFGPLGMCQGGRVTAVGNTMNISAAAGWAAVPLSSGQGAVVCYWNAAEVITLSAAPPSGQNRRDLIVIQVRDNALDAGGNNDFLVSAIAGAPAASNPALPAVPTNAFPLAEVPVAGGAANLNGAVIVDRRPTDTVEYNLAADTDITSTTFTSVLSGTFTPSGEQVRADLAATGFNVAVTSPRVSAQVVSGAQTKWLCAPAITAAGAAVFVGGSALFTGLTPGTTYTFTVQMASGAGTFRMRCATQPLLENLRLILSNA